MTAADAIRTDAEAHGALRSDAHGPIRGVTPAPRDPAAEHAASAVALAALITADQRHVAHMVATALALTPYEGPRAYAALRRILDRRLTSRERQGLAWAALGACTPEQAKGIAEDLFEINPPNRWPHASLDPNDATVEARLWAEDASHVELLAYGTAILQRLPARDRAELLRAAKPRPNRARRAPTSSRR